VRKTSRSTETSENNLQDPVVKEFRRILDESQKAMRGSDHETAFLRAKAAWEYYQSHMEPGLMSEIISKKNNATCEKGKVVKTFIESYCILIS